MRDVTETRRVATSDRGAFINNFSSTSACLRPTQDKRERPCTPGSSSPTYINPEMTGRLIVASQVSSLFTPSQATSVVLRTKQTHTPLPNSTTDSDPPPEHAIYANVFHSSLTGTILLRLLHGGLIVELISLSHDVPPLRIIYPASVVPSPSVVLYNSRELHVMAVISNGSLFRVVIPLHQDGTLWNTFTTNHEFSREYVISKLKGETQGSLVSVQDAHSLVVGLPDGSLLRIEARRVANENEDDLWEESIHHHTSFLTSFKTLLNPSVPEGQEIISIVSHLEPTEMGYVWTMSRDRTLRQWSVVGCVWSRTVSHSSVNRSFTSSPGPAPTALLAREPQRLLFAFTHGSEEYVLAFIPTETSPTSGGFFQLLHLSGDNVVEATFIECSAGTIHNHLHDFMVVGGVLYTVWDHQGQTIVESKNVLNGTSWEQITHPQESELTPDYLDELLLYPGSLAERFFEAIMRPGVFSPLTLHTALNQYIGECLSLPLPANSHPPQLLTSYPTVGENIAAVVGCTVKLLKDPKTGAPHYSDYWNALKRDWEGFIARCREIERSARWPIAIGTTGSDGDIFIIERERFGTIVREDLPLHLYRFLCLSIPLSRQYSLLEVVWTLRTKLGQQAMVMLERNLIDIGHQEIAFSYSDIIQDQVGRSSFRDDLDEGLESWILGRLQTIDDIAKTTRAAFEVVNDYEDKVKGEEEEVELLLPSSHTEWRKALATSFAASSIHARYELCLALMTLLFFLHDELHKWDPSLLAQIFAIFRGLSVLRYTSRQPAGKTSQQEQEPDDDVISRMRNMNVSSGRSQYSPTYSLVHRLLPQIEPTSDIPTVAHRFLDWSGLLDSTSPAGTTAHEILYCERLRLLGYLDAAKESLAWLPRTPGVLYVSARLLLDECRFEDAASAFEGLAASFGLDSGLTEDRGPLAAVLPGAQLFESDFHFYIHVASLFRTSGVICYDVKFSQLALSVPPPDSDLSHLWYNVIRGLTDLGRYEDAYNAIISSPYDKMNRECTSQLVHRMCEDHAVDRLMSFNFAKLADEVEDCLSFKARHADPRIRPFYSIILYTWYVSRGDHRNAAMVMYQRARKLGTLRATPEDFLAISELQLEAYAVSINSLSLIDEKSAWFTLPIMSSESKLEPRKRRKLSKYIPEDRYAHGTRDTEIVEMGDIRYEYALVSAQLALLRIDPQFLLASELLHSPTSIVLRLAQACRFNTAMRAAHAMGVDMTDIFAHLTNLCLRLGHNPDATLEDTSDWLLTDKVSSWPGNFAERGWRYLRQSLERHDGPQSDYAYSKVTLETILAFDRSSPPPPWLVHTLEDHQPEFLVRACLRYDVLEFALETVLTLMRKSDKVLAQERPKNASATWLPYNLIDQVIVAAESQADLSAKGVTLKKELRTEIGNRLKLVQSLSPQPRS